MKGTFHKKKIKKDKRWKRGLCLGFTAIGCIGG